MFRKDTLQIIVGSFSRYLDYNHAFEYIGIKIIFNLTFTIFFSYFFSLLFIIFSSRVTNHRQITASCIR